MSNEKRHFVTQKIKSNQIIMARPSWRAADDDDDGYDDVSYVSRGTRFDHGGHGASGGASTSSSRALVSVREETVRDERGRRRFHGAFTGGFSAGHFNTVGSVEGFAPKSFKSARGGGGGGGRKEASTPLDFMDEDERAEYRATTLRTGRAYDTFGEGQREAHRAVAWERGGKDGGEAGALGTSSALTDLVAPVETGVGAKLLALMGWRRGKRRTGGGVSADGDGGGVDAPPAYVVDPKSDRHGLGYDPFSGAEEFREAAKRRRSAMDEENSGARRGRARGEAFGVGVFEEEDASLYTEDEPKLNEYAFEMVDEEEEDERDHRNRPGGAPVFALGAALPNDCVVRGFRVSNDTLAPPKWFEPPVVPRDFKPKAAKARARSLIMASKQPELPPEAPPPRDEERRKVIDTLATFVAKHGREFEEMAKSRQGEDDEKFSFLFGGRDAAYYKWVVAKASQEHRSGADAPPARRDRPLGMEERAKILGEELLPSRSAGRAEDVPAQSAGTQPTERKKLSIEGIAADDRARIQSLLSKTFTSGGIVETAKVEKVGLHVLEKNATKQEPVSKPDEAEQAALVTQMPIVAARNTIEWAPEPLLCKRFGIPDPYANRSRPDVSQYKFRTDVLALDATSAKAQADAPKYLDAGAPKKKAAERTKKSLVAVPPPPPDQVNVPPPPPSPPREPDQAAYVEKPMGLFKAIFENSDDDIDEEENENEIEADLEAIQTALGEKPPKLAPAKPDENNRPVWSSAVMSKSSRRDHSPERDDRDSSRRKRSKREKKDKRDRKDRKERRSKSSRKDSRKHRKRSRRDYDSSSSSYSD